MPTDPAALPAPVAIPPATSVAIARYVASLDAYHAAEKTTDAAQTAEAVAKTDYQNKWQKVLATTPAAGAYMLTDGRVLVIGSGDFPEPVPVVS